MNKHWVKCELHAHTVHSDGNFTLDELAEKASNLYDLDYLALTDHNTITGHRDIDMVTKKHDLSIIPAIELTTYYGHIVVLGTHEYVEWRDLTKDNLNKRLQQLNKTDSIVGIAHPFRIGDPISTGTHFKYQSIDWNLVDYIEVWSLQHPTIKYDTKLSFRLWDRLLNKGYKISGVYGRDWHRGGQKEDIKTYNLVYVEEKNQHEVLQNIRKGNLMCSYGPLLQLSISDDGKTKKQIHYGESFSRQDDPIVLHIDWDFSIVKDNLNFKNEELDLRINTNIGIIQEIKKSKHMNESQIKVDLKDVNWFRLEVFGEIKGERVMIAFTNPVYVH